ncbi:hypothetical protein ACFSRY_18065 [Pontibacter locisalis]|uniref:DUF1440 domain-containing protein n=1 Tax=Pontibacter locisalis TaxID=1719035 RepID=A0ABW5IR36_9BACT
MKKKNSKRKENDQEVNSNIARMAAGIGIGIVAGLVGTAVMTAAQMIEMQYSGRKPSNTPYKAIKKTFGIEAQSEEDQELITNQSHIAYGTTWGIPRGVMAVFGADGVAGTSVHFGAVWGTELTMLPAMDVVEPVTTWGPKAIAENAMFHAVYAIATEFTADALTRWLHASFVK